MKIKSLLESLLNLYYKNDYGYIRGKWKGDYFWVDELYIYPQYRNQGYGKKLAGHIPQKAMLLAQPLVNKDKNNIDKDSLINFYKSLGFTLKPDSFGNNIMIRN